MVSDAPEINLYGTMELLGRVIRQAILDYQNIKRIKLTKIRYTRSYIEFREKQAEDARLFLFTGRLTRYLKRYHIDNYLSVSYIRWFAENIMLYNLDKDYDNPTNYNHVPKGLPLL